MKMIRPVTVTQALLTSSNVPETDYPAYVPGTSYGAGSAYRVMYNHHNYESLQAANAGHQPDISPTWWLDLGATNRYAMFDTVVGTATTVVGPIDVTVTPGAVSDAVAVLNADAASALITVTDPIEGLVYTKSLNLTSDSGIIDWYMFFTEPVVRFTEFAVLDLPPYASAAIRVQLSGTTGSSVVSAGVLVIGQQSNLGRTQYGASLGINSYSTKEKDTFGNTIIVSRSYARRGEYSITMPAAATTRVYNQLASYRDVPIVYIGSELSQYGATLNYGYFSTFQVVITFFDESTCSLTVEGLT